MIRRGLAIACVAATAAVALNPVLLRLPFSNRTRLAHALVAMRDPRGFFPEYPAFIEDVRASTKPGDSICLVVPGTGWNSTYSQAYLRAVYLLAGRDVLPVITTDSRPVPDNLRRARFVAIWNLPGERIEGRTVFERHRGRLLAIR